MRALGKKILKQIFPQLVYSRYIRRASAAEIETTLLPELCRPNSLAVDVGANRGLYIHHLLSITDRIVAFEPLPEMQATLRSQYGDRITLECAALSDSTGSSELRLPAGNYSWATIEFKNDLALADNIVSISVPTRPLDSYGFSNVGFIKIDVEGHEERVIHGALATIRKERPVLLVEIEERHNSGALGRLSDTLRSLDYVGVYVDGRKVVDLSEFDVLRDQPISNVSVLGRGGRYINNFIFLPSEHARATVERMQRRVAANPHPVQSYAN